jgi:hypothetical protein
MIILVAGSGYVSKKAAEDLLIDFIIEGYEYQDVTFMFPSYITSDGLKNVKAAVDDINKTVYQGDLDGQLYWNTIRVKKHELGYKFVEHDGEPKLVLVLDAVSEKDLLVELNPHVNGIFDLTKGLWPVAVKSDGSVDAEVPLSVAESHAEGQTLDPWYDEVVVAEIGSESRREAIDTLQGLNDRQRREVEEIVLRIGREELHPVYVQDNVEPDLDAAEEAVAAQVFGDKTAYYKSKTGKLRRVGKSKARPGEELVYLKPEEVERT